MKRFYIIIVSCIMIFTLSCCTNNTDNMKTIYISDTKTIKIPNEWVYYDSFSNDLLCYKDSNDEIIMFEISPNYEIIVETNEYYHSTVKFSNEEYGDYIITYKSNAVYSNGMIFGIANFKNENINSEIYYLSYEDSELFIWPNNVTFDLVKQIAKTYIDYS